MIILWKDNLKNYLWNIIQIKIKKIKKKQKRLKYFVFRHYAKIINAYEVLKDPVTRKIYN